MGTQSTKHIIHLLYLLVMWWCHYLHQNRSCAFPSFRLSRWRARLAAREPPGALSWWKEILHQVIINRRFFTSKGGAGFPSINSMVGKMAHLWFENYWNFPWHQAIVNIHFGPCATLESIHLKLKSEGDSAFIILNTNICLPSSPRSFSSCKALKEGLFPVQTTFSGDVLWLHFIIWLAR